MTEPLFTLARVSMRFGRHFALRDVDLNLHAGERVALVGHNGAGKSTLIKLMLGLLRPSAGRIQAPDRAGLGYLPENVAFPPAMTGAETLDFYSRLKRLDPRANRGLLGRVGLADAAGKRIGTYSKGMRQRLGLAQAILGQPRALLLDEPTTGLDPVARQDLYAVIAELRDAGVCVLLSSHALAELEDKVDRVVVMQDGWKTADGTLADLRALTGIPPRLRFNQAGIASEVICAEADLAERLRALPPGVTGVEIIRPSLDDIYAGFLRRERG